MDKVDKEYVKEKTDALTKEFVATANKAMTKEGIPAWVVQLMAENLVEQLKQIPDGMGAHMIVMDENGKPIAGHDTEGFDPSTVVHTVQAKGTIDLKGRTAKVERIQGDGPGAALLRMTSKYMH